MRTNAQVAYQAAAFGGESQHEADVRPRATALYTWLQSAAVPAARAVTDAVTATNTTLTSATAAFDAVLDVGAAVTGPGVAANTTIVSVQSATSVTLSNATTATAVGVHVTITPVSTGRSVANAQAALLGAATAWSDFAGEYPTSELTAHAARLLADITAHAAGLEA